MAVTKIQRVKSITHAVNYITREDKTERDLITSHNCTPEFAKKDFESILDEYNYRKGKQRELKPRMIIQSYDPSEKITPEQAHEYAKEFAKNYLKDEFQYIIATHHDTDHIHNHIIFNDINYKTFDVFDSSRENTLNRMRNENDLISDKYNLQVIEKTRQKHKYLTHKDYVARAKGVSFKETIENDIDKSIMQSGSYDEFLQNMKEKGYEVKEGKHLAFKSSTGKKFIRTKSLGFNYLENSLKYRIDNKEYTPFKPKIIAREWIDKSEKKFTENKGLYRWASIQNINYLHEVNSVLSKENISLEQFVKENEVVEGFEKNLETKLVKLDNQLHKLRSMEDSFEIYKDSYDMMIDFKKLDTEEEKSQFKEVNYSKFKKYDMAKKSIGILKKGYNIHNADQLRERLESLTAERNLLYESVNLNKEISLKKNREKKSEKRRDEMEL